MCWGEARRERTQVKAQAEVERRQRTAALNEELLARQQAEELLLSEQVTFEPALTIAVHPRLALRF